MLTAAEIVKRAKEWALSQGFSNDEALDYANSYIKVRGEAAFTDWMTTDEDKD